MLISELIDIKPKTQTNILNNTSRAKNILTFDITMYE